MSARSRVAALAAGILSLLVPPRQTEDLVASLSVRDLHLMRGERSGAQPFLLPYRDKRAAALIWELKYRRSARAAALAAAFMQEEIRGIASEMLGKPLLIPIPMHPERRRERGGNHLDLLGEELAKAMPDALMYAPEALRRTRATPPQQGLSRAERLRNVVHSMEAAAPLVRGRACILIDDVTTTGATFAEAQRALREAGAAGIAYLALAG